MLQIECSVICAVHFKDTSVIFTINKCLHGIPGERSLIEINETELWLSFICPKSH